MNVDLEGAVLVRRYATSDLMKQPVFAFQPQTGRLEEVAADGLQVRGFLVDNENVVAGPSRVIFYRSEGRSFIVVGDRPIEVGPGAGSTSHRRGALLSTLRVVSRHGAEIVVRYLTPWWRLLLDDARHPELCFPLQEFAQQLSDPPARGYLGS